METSELVHCAMTKDMHTILLHRCYPCYCHHHHSHFDQHAHPNYRWLNVGFLMLVHVRLFKKYHLSTLFFSFFPEFIPLSIHISKQYRN